MGNGMNKIIPGLYLGNIRDAKDMEQLTEEKITHVISIHDNAQPIRDHLIYKCLKAADHPDQDLKPFFQESIDFIHECRTSDGRCLVHCIAGVSRSTTIVAAYLLTITELTWRQTLQAIRSCRAIANPNYGFKRQLQDFYRNDLEKEKERIKTKYPDLDFTGSDHDYLLSLLKTNEDMSRDDDDIPDVLNLYDHRARRMRQNNENNVASQDE